MGNSPHRSNEPHTTRKLRAGARWVEIADSVCRRLLLALAVLLAAMLLAQTALRFDAVRSLLSITEQLEGFPAAGIVFCIPLHPVV